MEINYQLIQEKVKYKLQTTGITNDKAISVFTKLCFNDYKLAL